MIVKFSIRKHNQDSQITCFSKSSNIENFIQQSRIVCLLFCINFASILHHIKFFAQSNLQQWRQSRSLTFNCTNKWSNFVWILSIELIMIQISRSTKFQRINWVLKLCTSNFELWSKRTKFWSRKMLVFELVATIIAKNFINWRKKWLLYAHSLKSHYANNNMTIQSYTIQMSKNNFENQTYYVSIHISSIVSRSLFHSSLFLYFRFRNVLYCSTLIWHRIRITSNIQTSMTSMTIETSESNEKKTCWRKFEFARCNFLSSNIKSTTLVVIRKRLHMTSSKLEHASTTTISIQQLTNYWRIWTLVSVRGMAPEMYSRDNSMTRLITAELIALQISQYILVLPVELYEPLNPCAWISSRYAIWVPGG